MINTKHILILLIAAFFLSSYCVLRNYAHIKQDRLMFIPKAIMDLYAANPGIGTEGGQSANLILTAINNDAASAAAAVSPHTHVPGSWVVDFDGVVDILDNAMRCTFGYTTVSGYSEATAFITERIVEEDNIIAFDIAFLETYEFLLVGVSPLPGGTTDGLNLRTALRHEILHGLGVLHTTCPSSIMFPSQGSDLVALTTDDINGIKCLYEDFTPGPVNGCAESNCCCHEKNRFPGVSRHNEGAIDVLDVIGMDIHKDENHITHFNWSAELPVADLIGFNILESKHDQPYIMGSVNSDLIVYDESTTDYSLLKEADADTESKYFLELVFEEKGKRIVPIN
ncbi:MAG: matrixin family metalloprotease [Bacteroidota bacterium]